jgi:osmoprotectant transport system substrate-binding protein
MRSRIAQRGGVLVAIAIVLAACGSNGQPGSTGEGTEGESTEGASTEGASTEGASTEGASTEGEGSQGSAIAEQIDLSGAEITIGSKEFTEQLILGEITIQALEAAGASVSDQIGLQGSEVVREALTSGQIDAYWEYTGTGWITHLGNTEPVTGEEEQFQAVAEADAENDITWFAVAPANNTYAIAVKEEGGPDITMLSEISSITSEEDPGLCAATEFLNRDDGLPGLQEAYGFEFTDITEVELGLVYTQIGSACVFGEVFATDGRIAAQDLRTLEDDENFFPQYNVAMTMREQVYDENSEAYEELFGPIAETLTNERLRELNELVDVEGQAPDDVATQFLIDEGIISG